MKTARDKLIPLLPALVIFPLGVWYFVDPLHKFIWAAIGLLFLLKVGSLLRTLLTTSSKLRWTGMVNFLFFWPGMRPEDFLTKSSTLEPVGGIFVKGFIFFLTGIALQIGLFYTWSELPSPLKLYAGLFTFLIAIHLGFSALLFVFYRLIGYPVSPLFHAPLQSQSLRDFWSSQWNLAFVDMNKRLFIPLIPKNWPRWVGFIAIFLLSGILHELGISYPVDAGWGTPFAYFVIQGVLTLLEPHILKYLPMAWLKRIWVWLALLLPVPLLFHQAFLVAFIEPYFQWGHELIASIPLETLLTYGIYLCGAGHFLVLTASVQVPSRLNWKQDLAQLIPFNRKIFWVYGGYILLCIVSFGTFDLVGGQQLLEKSFGTTALVLFIALFWTIRVVVDFTYYEHSDWPKGDEFVIGHTCLTALFSFLALVHWSLFLWQL